MLAMSPEMAPKFAASRAKLADFRAKRAYLPAKMTNLGVILGQKVVIFV